MATEPTFDFVTEGFDAGLVVGLASPGMASLVAIDHLISELDTTQTGHVDANGLPTATPFTDGTPRHPTRLYGTDEGVSLLVGEAFFPAGVGERFADALVGAAAGSGVEKVTVVHGVPYPHDEAGHAVFSVATEDYDTEAFERHGVTPLGGGFLDGAVGRLLARGMAEEAPSVGTLITPAHPPGPDFEAALLLLDAVADGLGIDVDTGELRERSARARKHYEELAERMRRVADDRSADAPEDRMYM